jgi:fucose 4-O-acetylase-like acetyltransferase
MQARENWVDYAKAIGIILVVYGHITRGLYNGGIEFSDNYYHLFDSVVYSFHMPLFFFLSGLFFNKSFFKNGPFNLVLDKVDTIFYPYIIWSLLQGSIEVFLSRYTNGSVSWVDVISLLWSPRAQFWFLYALFFIFILSSIIYSFVSSRFVIFLFFDSVIIYLFPYLLPEGLVFNYISSYLVYFFLGIIFTRYGSVKYLSSIPVLLGVSFLFIFSQWFYHQYLSLGYDDVGIESLILAFISIIFVVSISLWLTRNENFNFFSYIGASSMAIYLMHILAGSGARVILSTFLGVDSALIHLIVGCAVGVVLPLLVLFFIKKFSIKNVFSFPVSIFALRLYDKFPLWRI